MTVEQSNNSKVPVIVIDKKLEQFRGKTLFPEKLAKANEILSKAGLPQVNKKNKSYNRFIQVLLEVVAININIIALLL